MVKNSVGNGEARELICTTHGHELWVGEYWRVKGNEGKEKKKNNRIVNEIYFKKRESFILSSYIMVGYSYSFLKMPAKID